ncbi:MAG: flagellar biosynthesis protein FlhF [Pirellulales bacterium]|nr:flagellar biosynthesis protein FlhF [Pirellulales bacterium]
MQIKTFRANSLQQALDMVRRDMGMEATILHTRELRRGLVSCLWRSKQYEIAACGGGLASQNASREESRRSIIEPVAPAITGFDYRNKYRQDFGNQVEGQEGLNALAEQLQQGSMQLPQRQVPEGVFQVYTDMIESDIDEMIAQELLQRLQTGIGRDSNDPTELQAEVARMLEEEIRVSGPIQPLAEQGRVVALVGPTGVGKTTTIAKLAANFRLRENRRVGLITVDTYRIAAVEQLRTYADIIDLPMEVVSTPREMREAVARMRNFDLVLMDTAGRSPRDEVKIQELKSILAEADPDEVHLVLSATAGIRPLVSAAKEFSSVGTTAILITKLDESTCLGNLLGLTRACGLPISYLTDGQNVPDDIQVAESSQLAKMILGVC